MKPENEASRHVPQKDYYTVEDVANLLQISTNKVYELANNRRDPLPFMRIKQMRRGMFISRTDFGEWVRRNSVLILIQNEKLKPKHVGK